MTKYRYLLKISYIGTHYHGWQSQQNALSVQQVIEEKISTLFSTNIKVVGSSRTDSGVHALGQVAHVDIPYNLEEQNIIRHLNHMLPDDISIINIKKVDDSIHARFSAISRLYQYKITKHKNPFEMAYWLDYDLDIETLNIAAKMVLKNNNFETFSKLGTISQHGYMCNIYQSQWENNNGTLIYSVKANRFLRGMVRALVGNMLRAGMHQMTTEEFYNIMESHNRSKSYNLAPPYGLTLVQVDYNLAD